MADSENMVGQFLTFQLKPELYGVNVLQVREVLEVPQITRIPRMPGFMLGVINIRGLVVPVIDLRLKMGLDPGERSIHSRVIIIDTMQGDKVLALSILVDAVHEVIDISAGQVSPPPSIGSRLDVQFISGIAQASANFVVLLDLGNLFREDKELADIVAEPSIGSD